MKKSLFDVNLFILLFAIALILSSCDRNCAAQDAGTNDKGTLYFFTNEGCRPCKQVEPILLELAKNGYPITKVDTTAYPDWVRQFRISSTPTLVLVKGSREIQRHSGFVDSATVTNWFRSIGFSPNRNTRVTSAPPASRSQDPAVQEFDNRRIADTLDGDTSTMHQGTRTPGTRVEQTAMDATVRIRVEDPEGVSFATGTVIHCHQGEWLVMTCGHVFRDSSGQGEISVEYGFDKGSPRRAPARMISYDAKSRDVGMIAVNAGIDITPVPLAERNAPIQRSESVFSIGCDHGEPPTIRRTKIKRTAAYDTDQITKYDIYGRPVDGRSGGGLFTSDGKLIGICNAACVDFDEGIYTALDTIYWQLAQNRLDHLFESRPQIVAAGNLTGPSRGGRNEAEVDRISRTLAGTIRQDQVAQAEYQQADSPRSTPFQKLQPANPRPENRFADNRPMGNAIRDVNWNSAEDRGKGSKSNDMEVILLVRSKTDPTRAEAITLSDPSPQLLKYLEKIGNRQSGKSRIDLAELRRQLN